MIAAYFDAHPLRGFWLSDEQDNPDVGAANETLRAALIDSGHVEAKILETLAGIAQKPGALLIVTDIEAIHPYLRIGAVEQRLQGKVPVPTVILYPGVRCGQTNLSFLGIYPDDGNYRSAHVGG